MRGTVLDFDAATDRGVVVNAGGDRFSFARADWLGPAHPLAGLSVDFEPADGRAGQIYVVSEGRAGRNAMAFGILSLVFALLPLAVARAGVLPPLVFLVLAVAFGTLGLKAARNDADRTAYRLSLAGLIASAAMVLVILIGFGVLSALAPERPNDDTSIKVQVQTPTVGGMDPENGTVADPVER